jgi:subtilisin family serine protease
MRSTKLPLYVAKAFLCSAVIAFAPALSSCSGSSAPGASGTNQIAATIEAKTVPGEILVKLRASASASDLDQVNADADADVSEDLVEVAGGRIHKLHVRGNVQVALQKISSNGAVEYAHPNYIYEAITIPNDTRFGELWGMLNTGQTIRGVVGTAGADIKAEPAWSVTTGSRNVVVGVVDTGIDYTHPDLSPNVWNNPGGIGGCAAGTHGYNAILRSCDPLDDHYHGTHVSGTIGAVGNNSLGVVGVNWNASIMGLKFLNAQGSGTTANAILAIDFAVNAKIAGINVRVLSNSWGGGPFNQALLDEINKANTNDILFVAAAGNSSANNDVTPNYPSNYNAPNVVAVAATDNRDQLASFSNYGATTVHLGGPGVDILSTMPGSIYDYLSGTSMATPHVSGAAALILSTQALNTAQLKSAILNNVDPIPALSGRTTTGGRLNVCKAIPGCGAPVADFSLSVSPTSQSVVQGSTTGAYAVNISRTGGFTGAVTFSTTGLPAGATATYNPNPASGASSSLTIATTASTAAGTYPFTITGVSGSLTRTTSATLVVTAPSTPDFSLSVSPSSQSVDQGSTTAAYSVSISRTGGFTGAVTFSTTGLPAGATATFNPNPASGASSSLTISTAPSTVDGTYPFTITGVSGSLTRTTSATLVVTIPGD